MSRIDLDKLRSINSGGRTRGTVRVRELTNTDDRTRAGFEIDYADGRQEAVVRPPTTRGRVNAETGEVAVG